MTRLNEKLKQEDFCWTEPDEEGNQHFKALASCV